VFQFTISVFQNEEHMSKQQYYQEEETKKKCAFSSTISNPREGTLFASTCQPIKIIKATTTSKLSVKSVYGCMYTRNSMLIEEIMRRD